MKKIIFILSIIISTAHASPLIRNSKARTDSVYICLSKSAYAYHSHMCRGLANCSHKIIKISKAEAIRMNKRACKNCY